MKKQSSSSPPVQKQQPTAKADIVAVFGASGSGKSLYTKALIQDTRRLIVFDSMAEYGGMPTVTTGKALVAALGKKEFRVAFVPAADDKKRAQAFALVCNLAFALGDCCLVVEELKFVTSPSWSPMEWGRITSQGRHKRLSVVATSQRPASVDKDFIGNCTRIRTGRLGYVDDAKYMAKALMVPESDLLALRPLDWIERDSATGEIKKGTYNPGNPL